MCENAVYVKMLKFASYIHFVSESRDFILAAEKVNMQLQLHETKPANWGLEK